MGAVVTVGTFDGVHRGHHAVVAEVVRRARVSGRRSVLVTFEPHPLEIVNPTAAPRLLTLPAERAALLAGLGLDEVAVLAFTPKLSRLDPEAFVRQVLRGQFGMEELVLGHDHGFGRGRSGDLETLRRQGAAEGFLVDAIAPVRDDGQAISSTLIRAAVAHGQLEQAARWLGRAYGVRGTVVPGAGRGGRLGVRTINLAPPDPRKLLPPDGVYAVWVERESRGPGAAARHGGMMNQGPRPTFGDDARTLEVHLFDFAGELYGETVTVEWVQRLRDVQAFPTAEALSAQLERDRAAAHASLNR